MSKRTRKLLLLLPFIFIMTAVILLTGCSNQNDQSLVDDSVIIRIDGNAIGNGSTINFGTVSIGQSQDKSFTIENNGSTDVSIYGDYTNFFGQDFSLLNFNTSQNINIGVG